MEIKVNKQEYRDWVDKHLVSINTDIEEIKGILSLDFKSIFELGIEDLQETVFKLRKYAIYLKMLYNEEKARYGYLNIELMKRAKPLAMNYSSYDKDERYQSAITESEPLTKIQDAVVEAQTKATSLEGIDREILWFTNTIEEIIKKKERQN
jgi:hypothetical protein